MLALEWYRSQPLPDSEPSKEPQNPGRLTELSQRLLGMFDHGMHCDVTFQAGVEMLPVSAHRIVLRRNPDISFDCGETIAITPGLCRETLHEIIRAHYMEVEHLDSCTHGIQEDAQTRADANPQDPGLGVCDLKGGEVLGSWDGVTPQARLLALRAQLPAEQKLLVEAVFGPIDTSRWTSLHEAVFTSHFADCRLQVSNGAELPAHCAIVAGIDDGHFFSAALRWPSSRNVICMPEGLSEEALHSLLRVRYGSDEVDTEHILEARHFAELFDWPAVTRRYDAHLETLLADASSIDTQSLLAVISHTEESATVPARLKAAALSAAVRQWSKVTEAAPASLPAQRCSELETLCHIRNRDGHVIGSLEEYLHACQDDLSEWERSLTLEAPLAARKQVERAWQHWHQILFEYGRLFGASNAERWRAKVRMLRDKLRDDRAVDQGKRLNLPPGKIWFEASFEWREVPQHAVCGAGLEYRCDMQTGKNYARLAL